MGEKPKKDKDRLRKQKILHPKADKIKAQIDRLVGSHNVHSRVDFGERNQLTENDWEKNKKVHYHKISFILSLIEILIYFDLLIQKDSKMSKLRKNI